MQKSSELVAGIFRDQTGPMGALQSLRDVGMDAHDMALLSSRGIEELPGEPRTGRIGGLPLAEELRQRSAEHPIGEALARLGIPDGAARYYLEAVDDGAEVLLVRARASNTEIRERLRAAGAVDVPLLGRDLVRGEGTAAGRPHARTVDGQPPDVTRRWEDVRSRYEMLWAQRFGATGGSWEEDEPAYRYAWQVANDPDIRGAAWEQVRERIRGSSDPRRPDMPTERLQTIAQDVWEDVADESREPIGGRARSTPGAWY